VAQSVIPKFIFMKCTYAPKEITNNIGMKLVLIPAGTFKMGSPLGEEGSDYDELQHEVTISKDYYIGAYTVTQAQYEKVMGKNPSYFHGRRVAERHPPSDLVVREVDSSNHPVENVSWENAVEFCKQLSGLTEEKTAGRVYRLPTEAEWEYACRAGSMTAFSFGDDMGSLGDFAWYIANSKKQTHPVGVKKPNAWGLYDMHGNVFEHCADWYEAYPQGSVLEQYGYNSRGGSWQSCAAHCRSASRGGGIHQSSRNCLHGFRLALSLSSQLAEPGTAEVAEPVIGN
jgi:formylglycine-generating enzyme required for sulfatase activity